MPTNLSYWIASTGETSHPPLTADKTCDVLVIGGGLVGLTTAFLLAQEGVEVTLIDMKGIGRGVTGYTTAKVTAGHGAIYHQLERAQGRDTARLYATANQAGFRLLTDIVTSEGIDCDLERKDNLVYVESPREKSMIEAEAAAARRAGLDAELVEETTLPYPVAGAVVLRDQAQFHPRKYLLGLADKVISAGGSIHEGTRAVRLQEGTPNIVTTPEAEIRARHVVVATHYPFVDRALLFARVHPKRSYAIAGPAEPAGIPDGMFISADQPTRSVRTIRDGEQSLLLIGGEGHAVGHKTDTAECYRNLESWARGRFGMSKISHRWSTQDGTSVDLVPFIGTYRAGSTVYVATAFGKWGFTNGTIGARIIADGILDRPNELARLYDPTRFPIRASVGRLARENAQVARHFAGDRVAHPQRGGSSELAPGEAVVEGNPLAPVAAYRDETGVLHRVSAVCTHLGCVVRWNTAEKSWDCPCHGSRFEPDGRVIQGPATENLEPRD